MELPLVNKEDSSLSQAKLTEYYEGDLIPPEKKPYLSKLEKSLGPYLGVEGKDGETAYILDGSSQIATLGLGFSPSALGGVGHFLESWSNRKDTPVALEVRHALEAFLKRMTGWKSLDCFLCHSGAEAVETALCLSYDRRSNISANKLLAFKDSFHGRTLVALGQTWNEKKRKPFQRPEVIVEFCSYPDLKGDKLVFPLPENWGVWERAVAVNFKKPPHGGDQCLAQEITALMEVRQKLMGGEFFAITIEPMQCEGGDRYSSNRFHYGLMAMARSFRVPLIYDEVQTGYHLGREFFWHRQFQLPFAPDYVVCAKKAQVGMVLSPWHHLRRGKEEFSFASLVRGLIQGITLCQAKNKISNLEKMAHQGLASLVEDFPDYIAHPRACGLAFAFDLVEKEHLNQFVKYRFEYGLLFYPAGESSLRFRLNISFTSEDVNFLFHQLNALGQYIFLGKRPSFSPVVKTSQRGVDDFYGHAKLLLKDKLQQLLGTPKEDALNYFKEYLANKTGGKVITIGAKNFSVYAVAIKKLQEEVYESARQTPIKEFRRGVMNSTSVAVGLEVGKELVAISVAVPLSLFSHKRGIVEDPRLYQLDTLYFMDTTVSSSYQGKRVGRILKYIALLMAKGRGVKFIRGKNRVGLAQAMLNVNLSLGSYEYSYLPGYYQDDPSTTGDSWYYSCPLQWTLAPLNLSKRVESPLEYPSPSLLENQLPYQVNKICLSNFVSDSFLQMLKDIAGQLPSDLQHLYTASGQSECVDKLAKSLWHHSKKSLPMMTFEGHYFGQGTFFARSLSYLSDNFFPVDTLPRPCQENWEEILAMISDRLAKDQYGGIWLEPVSQLDLVALERPFLKALVKLCRDKKVPLIYNETASAAFSYHKKSYFVSGDDELTPDGGFCYLGGQMGMVFCRPSLWVKSPLMMISTWDGDEFSLAKYHQSMVDILESQDEYEKSLTAFEKKLKKVLSPYPIEEIYLERGRGFFKGTLPFSLQSYFDHRGDLYVINPSFQAIKRFLEEQ